MTTPSWDPERYLAHADHRGRPLVDLLARVSADAPGSVVDLGCGTGNLTLLLTQRWPQARVVGVDSSPQMIQKRMTIVTCAQLSSSKWWWIGDILKMRLPCVSLK